MNKFKSHKDCKKDEPVVFVSVFKVRQLLLSYHLGEKLEPNILVYVAISFHTGIVFTVMFSFPYSSTPEVTCETLFLPLDLVFKCS